MVLPEPSWPVDSAPSAVGWSGVPDPPGIVRGTGSPPFAFVA